MAIDWTKACINGELVVKCVEVTFTIKKTTYNTVTFTIKKITYNTQFISYH